MLHHITWHDWQADHRLMPPSHPAKCSLLTRYATVVSTLYGLEPQKIHSQVAVHIQAKRLQQYQDKIAQESEAVLAHAQAQSAQSSLGLLVNQLSEEGAEPKEEAR